MDQAQAEELASSILDIPKDMGRKQSTEGMYICTRLGSQSLLQQHSPLTLTSITNYSHCWKAAEHVILYGMLTISHVEDTYEVKAWGYL